MPKLPRETQRLVFFLYRSEADARAGVAFGGTGFFIAVPSAAEPERPHILAITNWHVAVRGGNSTLRVNRASGGAEIIEYGPEDWIFCAGSHDIAALPFDPPNAGLDLMCVALEQFADDHFIDEYEVGPDADVFMPGRFVDIGGHETNLPSLRFGHISMMPQPIRQANGAVRPSYCIDMHSRSGFSGSPVFVYQTPGQDLSNLGDLGSAPSFLALLGVHFGQFPEPWEIKERKTNPAKVEHRGEVSLDGNEKYIEGLSGMTCIAPISALHELLEHPRIKAWLTEREATRNSEVEKSQADL